MQDEVHALKEQEATAQAQLCKATQELEAQALEITAWQSELTEARVSHQHFVFIRCSI